MRSVEGRTAPVLSGLVLGEQLSWTSLYERSFLLPFWTRRKRRELDVQSEADGLLEVNLPFALNQPTEALKPGPGPRAEWFIFQLQVLTGEGGNYSLERATAAWQKLAAEASLKLTISQLAALTNLRHGKVPPVTGYDNPHYFDDTACFRALATACVVADANAALEATRQDAGITNAEDGVWGAQAVTAALVMALQGADPNDCVDAAVRCLPEGSWIFEAARRALGCVREDQGTFGFIAQLNEIVTNRAYSYGDAAAETVPAALSIIKTTRGDPQRSLFIALALPRVVGLAPLVGALCGALGRPPNDALANLNAPLRGVALPFLAGTKLSEKLEQLSKRAGERTHGSHTH